MNARPDRERQLNDAFKIAASRLGARLFRNNVGLGWVGRIVKRVRGAITLSNPRPLHAGLFAGSSDLIGWQTVRITKEWLGRDVAIFVAVETKHSTTATTDEQRRFLAAVSSSGGIAMIARKEEDVTAVLSSPIAAIERRGPGQSPKDF